MQRIDKRIERRNGRAVELNVVRRCQFIAQHLPSNRKTAQLFNEREVGTYVTPVGRVFRPNPRDSDRFEIAVVGLRGTSKNAPSQPWANQIR
jgi:hypothetical protein